MVTAEESSEQSSWPPKPSSYEDLVKPRRRLRYISPGWLGYPLMLSAAAWVALLTVGMLTEFKEIVDPVESAAEPPSTTVAVAAIAVTFLGSYLAWVYYCARNVLVFGRDELGVSPLAAVGWNFVPIAGLIVPFFTHRRVWDASAKEQGTGGKAGIRLIGAWWWTWVTFLIVGAVSAFAPESYNPVIRLVHLPFGGFMTLLIFIFLDLSAIFFMGVILMFILRQDATAKHLGLLQSRRR